MAMLLPPADDFNLAKQEAATDLPQDRPTLFHAFRSWRTASVSVLSFSSGLPFSLIWLALPDWMRSIGIDIRAVGLITLAQAPWTFKFLWSPLIDRFMPLHLGRRRGWVILAQLALFSLTLALAAVGGHPRTLWIVALLAVAIAFASATQDIALDAYAVDVLRPDEQAVAVGARVAMYRLAMLVAGGLAITLAGRLSWPIVNTGLALLYLPMIVLTWKAPEPETVSPPPATLGDAVWLPFLAFLSRRHAFSILGFILLYGFSASLAQVLERPFLIDMGYGSVDRGIYLAGLGMTGVLVGAFLGGQLTRVMGLGRALWVCVSLGISTTFGFALLATQGRVNRPLMYTVVLLDTLAGGLDTGAVGVLLLRITEKRFSATQYALFSSLFGLSRLASGPIAGFVVDALGWYRFFFFCMVAGIPTLIFLARFSPWRFREPDLRTFRRRARSPLSRSGKYLRGMAGTLVGALLGSGITALLTALKRAKVAAGSFDFLTPFAALWRPHEAAGWLILIGVLAFAGVCGLLAAATSVAAHGSEFDLEAEES
jgi:PAT family beta-lactamase induction signal transducer AmpG